MSFPINVKNPDTRDFSAYKGGPFRLVEFHGGSLAGTHKMGTCYSGHLEQWCKNGKEVYRLYWKNQEGWVKIHMFYQLDRVEA